MKTDGLSINLATVRQQFGLKDGVEACLKHGITAIAPWRDHVQAVGLDEAARIIRSNGLKVTGYCRGGLFPAADAAGRQAAIDDNKTMIDEAAGDRRGLPDPDRRRPAEGLARHQGGAGHVRRRHGGGAAACAGRQGAARDRGAAPMYAADRGCISLLSEALDLCDALGAGVGVAIDVYHLWWDPNLAAQIKRAGRAHPGAPHLRLAGADEGSAARPRHDGRRRDRSSRHPPHGRGRGLPRPSGGGNLLG
jgi:sugar phosphate isomerase/epimerase